MYVDLANFELDYLSVRKPRKTQWPKSYRFHYGACLSGKSLEPKRICNVGFSTRWQSVAFSVLLKPTTYFFVGFITWGSYALRKDVLKQSTPLNIIRVRHPIACEQLDWHGCALTKRSTGWHDRRLDKKSSCNYRSTHRLRGNIHNRLWMQ